MPRVRAGARRVAPAERIVGEGATAALGVVKHSHLEQRTVGNHQFGELADERHVVDDVVGDAPADVAHDHRVAQSEAEDRRRFDSGIKACDDHDVEVWQHGCPFVTTGGGEGLVALECGCEMRHDRSPIEPVTRSRPGTECCDTIISPRGGRRGSGGSAVYIAWSRGALSDGSPPTGFTLPRSDPRALTVHETRHARRRLAEFLAAERSTISCNLALMEQRAWIDLVERSASGHLDGRGQPGRARRAPQRGGRLAGGSGPHRRRAWRRLPSDA